MSQSVPDPSKLAELMQMLKQDNENYRKNFENLKKEYLELQNHYNEQQIRWRNQLESKGSEFERMRKKFDMDSQELEAMKLKLVEELEIRQRLEKDISESDKYRSMYNELRRNFELAKSEHQQQMECMQKQMNEVKRESDTVIAELQDKIQEHRKIMSTHKHAEVLRNYTRENEELNVKVKQLLSELADVRNEKSAVLAQKEQAAIQNSQEFAQLLTKTRTLESENERYKKKLDRLNEELDELQRTNDKMHDNVLRVEKENIQLHNQMEEQLQAFNSERSAIKHNAEQREREGERERLQLKNQNTELYSRLEALQMSKQELLGQLTDAKTELTEKTRKMMFETNEKCSRLESQKNQLIQQIHDLERQNIHGASMLKDENLRLSKELEAIRNVHNTIVNERDDFKEKYTQLQNNIVPQLRRDTDAAEQEVRRLQDTVESSYKQIEGKNLECHELASKNERLRAHVEFLERQMQDMSSTVDKVHSKNKIIHKEVNHQLLQQYNDIMEKYKTLKNRSSSSIGKYKEQKEKLKQIAARYQLKIEKLKQEKDILTQQLAKSEETLSQVQNEIWQEKQSSSRKSSQMERELRKLQFMVEQRENDKLASAAETFSENYNEMLSSTVKQYENIADRVNKFIHSTK